MNWKKILNGALIVACCLCISTNITVMIYEYHQYDYYENLIEEEVANQKKIKFSESEYCDAKNLLLKYSYNYIIFRNKNKFMSQYVPIRSNTVMMEIAKAKMFLAVNDDGYIK